jgi:hypothetical protein
MAYAPITMSAAERVGFERQRSDIDYGYQQQIVQNAGQRQFLNVQQSQAQRDLARALNRARQQIPGQYAQRGLLRSGIYGAGLGEFEEDRIIAESRQARDFGMQRMDLTQALSSADINRAMQMANIDLSEAQRRSAIAAMLGGAY